MPATSTGPRNFGRVLVIDDDPAIRAMCRAVLRREGWEVDVAGDGQAGLAAVRAAGGDLDCVISDVHMPELDGHALLGEVGGVDEDLPVVLMTGDPRLESAVRAMEAGAVSYLSKPFMPEHLAAVVARAARRHGLARMRRRAAVFAASAPEAADADRQLDHALAQCWMAYQPLVDARTGAVLAYEALLRTNDPVLKRPDLLIGVAERVGRIPELGRIVRRLVAADLAHAPSDVRVFVNLHPVELTDEQLFSDANPLRPYAGRVVFELTERVGLDGLVDATNRVAMLRRAGFGIAIDDLGAGYASLGSLAAIEPDVVKLDMGLVRGIEHNPRQQRIVAAIATLCRELGSLVVAEGIETEDERAIIAPHVDVMQGYLFARPGRGLPALTAAA